MPLPAQVLAVAGMACFFAALGIAYMAWPRLKALERRGVLDRPVPEFSDEHRQAGRMFELVWLTPIPEDRTRLRRMLWAVRILILAGIGLMVGAMVISANTLVEPTPGPVEDGPVPIRIEAPPREPAA